MNQAPGGWATPLSEVSAGPGSPYGVTGFHTPIGTVRWEETGPRWMVVVNLRVKAAGALGVRMARGIAGRLQVRARAGLTREPRYGRLRWPAAPASAAQPRMEQWLEQWSLTQPVRRAQPDGLAGSALFPSSPREHGQNTALSQEVKGTKSGSFPNWDLVHGGSNLSCFGPPHRGYLPRHGFRLPITGRTCPTAPRPPALDPPGTRVRSGHCHGHWPAGMDCDRVKVCKGRRRLPTAQPLAPGPSAPRQAVQTTPGPHPTCLSVAGQVAR